VAADVGVQARVSLPASGVPTVGVLARANVVAGKLTAYEARLTRAKATTPVTAQIVRTVNGVSTVVASASAGKLGSGSVRVEVVGQFLWLLVDGRQLAEFTDTVSLAGGQVGFAGTANAPTAVGVAFDDFQAAPVSPGLSLALPGSLGPTWKVVSGAFTVQDT